jgi:hypothetical protein
LGHKFSHAFDTHMLEVGIHRLFRTCHCRIEKLQHLIALHELYHIFFIETFVYKCFQFIEMRFMFVYKQVNVITNCVMLWTQLIRGIKLRFLAYASTFHSILKLKRTRCIRRLVCLAFAMSRRLCTCDTWNFLKPTTFLRVRCTKFLKPFQWSSARSVRTRSVHNCFWMAERGVKNQFYKCDLSATAPLGATRRHCATRN